jgi:DNA invertase Pin-like site-specific DNA recombinase
MLSIFAEFERDIIRERVKAGITEVRANSKKPGPKTAAIKKDEVKKLKTETKDQPRVSEIFSGNFRTPLLIKA